MLLKVNNVYLQYPSPGGEGLFFCPFEFIT